MLTRFFKFTVLILLVFGFRAGASPVDLHRVTYVKHHAEKPKQTTVSKSDRQNINSLLSGESSAAHLTSQTYRPTHFAKQAFVLSQLVFASVACLKYICHSSRVSYSRFCKLVLFPFHAFW